MQAVLCASLWHIAHAGVHMCACAANALLVNIGERYPDGVGLGVCVCPCKCGSVPVYCMGPLGLLGHLHWLARTCLCLCVQR